MKIYNKNVVGGRNKKVKQDSFGSSRMHEKKREREQKRMRNLKVSAKLVFSFVIVIIMAIIVGVAGIYGMGRLNGASTDIYISNIGAIDPMADFREAFQMERNETRNIILVTGDPVALQNSKSTIDSLDQEIQKAMEAYEATITDEAAETSYYSAKSLFLNEYKEIKDQIFEAAVAGDQDLAHQRLIDGASVATDISDGLKAAALQNSQWASEANSESDELYKTLTIVLAVVLAAVVVVSMLLAFYISSLIAKPLNKMKDAAVEIAKGHIDITVDYQSKDEIGSLAEAFRSVIESLNLLDASMKQLKGWATEGKITERVQEDGRIQGAYQDIVNGVNGIMDTFGKHFDSIPVGVAIVDVSNKVLFENKTVHEYKSISEDNLQKQTSDFADESGKTAGTLVVTVDQTTVLEAQRESERQAANVAAQMKIAEKQADYQAGEIDKLIVALEKLSKGDLNIAVSQAACDDDTRVICENFKKLGDSLEESCANIRSYIDELDEVLGEIADKNLNIGISREYLGDFAALKTSINNITDTLNEIFGEISGATNQVQNGSQQVANSSQSLAQGASEQASAVEEISSTIAEVAAQTRNNAENASKASEMSLEAKGDAETGNRQMDEMVKAMDAIKEASRGIASIIKVIEDIAFQTNILALNAAVEAARAGEHGKGFAVVAEEVRTLAARSAAAAKETTEMIDNSLTRVEIGSKIAGETAAALGKIVAGVTNTVDVVATIAEASAQQSTAISQIDNGVEQISKVTQSNTATAEESASASEEMAGQAQMLQSMINAFNLRGQKSSKGGGAHAGVKSIPAPSRLKQPETEIFLGDGDFGKY